jgi:hypothetical protein
MGRIWLRQDMGLSHRLKGGVSWKTKSTRLEKIATQIGKDMAAPR